jgi:hypothetical protein
MKLRLLDIKMLQSKGVNTFEYDFLEFSTFLVVFEVKIGLRVLNEVK